MNEDSRVEESRKRVAHLDLIFQDGQVEAKVVARANSIQEAVELAQSVCNEWLSLSNGENDVTKITELGPVVVTKQASVAEDQEASAVGVAGDGNSNIPPAALALLKRMPLEDLRAISTIVVDELARRGGAQDRNPETADLGQIHGGITGGVTPTGTPTFGDSVTDN